MKDAKQDSAFADTAVRPRPALFRALGRNEPPDDITVDGCCYHKVHIFKHDSWAATALYVNDRSAVVCKFNRQQRIGIVPMRWLGRMLARREGAILRRLDDLAHVPRCLGGVYVSGSKLSHAVAHEFIPGHPLGLRERVGDDFFPALQKFLAEMHRRRIAYVDFNKRENILVGADGKPYLIDFQISLALPNWWPANSLLTRCLLRIFQRSDVYHLQKHFARCRPDQLGYGLDQMAAHRPWWIRAHRIIGVPLRSLRRWLLVKLGIRKGRGRVHSEHFPEEVVRHDIDVSKPAA